MDEERLEKLRQLEYEKQGLLLEHNLRILSNMETDYIMEYGHDEALREYIAEIKYYESLDKTQDGYACLADNIKNKLNILGSKYNVCMGYKSILNEYNSIALEYDKHNRGAMTAFHVYDGVSQFIRLLLSNMKDCFDRGGMPQYMLYILNVALKQEAFIVPTAGYYNEDVEKISVLEYIKLVFKDDLYKYLLDNGYINNNITR